MTLVYACCAWLLGVYIGHEWSGGSSYAWVLIPPLLVALWTVRKNHARRFTVALGLVAVLGALRMAAVLPDVGPGSLAYYNDRWTSLTGTVTARPGVRDNKVNLTVEVDEVRLDSEPRPVGGRVLVTTPLYPRVEYGERLRVDGYLQEPPIFEDFSYRDYLARKGISSLMYYPDVHVLSHGHGSRVSEMLHAIRQHGEWTIDRILPYPEAALLGGILLGRYSAIPKELMDSFNATGTSHIIVISGFNISVLAVVLMRLANQFVSRRQAALVCIAGIVFYCCLVGADAAVRRAAIMGSTIMIAVLFGRESNALTSLALAALILTAVDPLALWDVSFQLSAGATLGLVLFASPLYQQAQRMVAGSGFSQSLLPLFKDTVIATLAAQVFTLPLILSHFKRLSVVMPLANILVLPAQPPLMGSGAVALLAGSIWMPAGRFVAWGAWLFLTYTIRVVELLGSIPYASVGIGHLPEACVWGYFGIVLLVLWARKQDGQRLQELWQIGTRHLTAKVVLAALLLFCVLVWVAVFSLPDGRLHVRYLDVGQGDAALITLPDGQQILIDGGPSPTTLLSELGRAMPFWDHKIELVILSHPDEDHLMGLVALLERYEVGQVIDSSAESEADLYLQWRHLIKENQIPGVPAHRGMFVDLGDGAHIDVLHPHPSILMQDAITSNDASTVLRLALGEVSFLFTGDLEAYGESILLESGQNLESTVLKVSHHGAKEGTTELFLQAVDPRLAVISVGSNRFGHPAKETLDRLDGVPVLRTDRTGTLDIRTDGTEYWTDVSM